MLTFLRKQLTEAAIDWSGAECPDVKPFRIALARVTARYSNDDQDDDDSDLDDEDDDDSDLDDEEYG